MLCTGGVGCEAPQSKSAGQTGSAVGVFAIAVNLETRLMEVESLPFTIVQCGTAASLEAPLRRRES